MQKSNEPNFKQSYFPDGCRTTLRNLCTFARGLHCATKRELPTPASIQSNPPALLTRIRSLSLPKPSLNPSGFLPSFSMVQGQGLVVRLVAGGLGLLLLLAVPTGADLVLALATIGLVISQVKRGCRPLGSLGWSLALVALGLLVGATFSALLSPQVALPLSSVQLQALPAYLVLLAGSLLLL